ncbi:hypothetical protein [Rhodococcus sp. T7]|uniref:hypothetical protein n=1 Tax=Rhodococcus sp. T7 TaxID=627444 RepID=UPI00135869DA|nr:hypothetical protein [Rhodococcus sp. T7]KAF0956847.1 hypothetical protein MLGJGCBP_09927 [Rhodococcus sp. T7]KAF0962041.1 hypothetical protein MLGJGCBP_04823 [Rhodococcus sp. T7]
MADIDRTTDEYQQRMDEEADWAERNYDSEEVTGYEEELDLDAPRRLRVPRRTPSGDWEYHDQEPDNREAGIQPTSGRSNESAAADAGSLEPQEQLDLDPSWATGEDGEQVAADEPDWSDDYAHSPALTKEPAPTPTRAVDDGVRVDPIVARPRDNQTKRSKQRAAPPPNQRVNDIAAFLTDVEERHRTGQKVARPKPIREVLGVYRGAPIDQTRIQVLAAAAAARHLEGADSANAQRLNKLVQDNDARLRSLREHERRNAVLFHAANETTKEELAVADQERIERETTNDRRVFDAASAVALGYVAARGLPAYDQLAQLSEAQLGPVPETAAEESAENASASGGQSKVDKTKSVLDSVGRGLAQAAGPVAGDDDVAANLSPINLTQLNEELANLAASIAPAMKAAMSSHPRSIKELLNVEQRPDEESELAFEQESELDRGHRRDAAHSV